MIIIISLWRLSRYISLNSDDLQIVWNIFICTIHGAYATALCDQTLAYYSARVAKRSIAISLSVCLSACLSASEHISGTAVPIFTKFSVQILCGRGSVLLWRRCDTLCILPVLWMTSSLDVMGPMAMRGRLNLNLLPLRERHCNTGAESDVYECLA